jgi:hypothetical protein
MEEHPKVYIAPLLFPGQVLNSVAFFTSAVRSANCPPIITNHIAFDEEELPISGFLPKTIASWLIQEDGQVRKLSEFMSRKALPC